MKKNYFIALLALVVNFVSAQIEPTTYRGAFAPAPTAMWTDSWTNWDPQNEPYTDPTTTGSVVNVTTNITANTTWTTGKTYKLTGLIYVTNNATLTIQPGVIVKGVYTNTGTALIITKGAKLNAIGTATQPIVFTSNKAAGQRAAGDWGGVILLGKAGFNLNGGVNNIEGITATVNTEYGGGATPDDNDNSGTMKYCRIEFPGYVFSPNNEINGLTLGAVGRGTTIDYVQVSYSGDDSFEWFGGAVNCKHLVAYRGLDDDFDTDNGYKGIVQFALGVRDPSIADNPSVSTSEGFESDNNASGTTTAGTDNTTAIFTNCTLIGPSFRATIAPTATVAAGHARALRLRRATQLKVFNSIFLDFRNNFLFIDGTAAVANANGGTLKFKNNTIAGTPDATFTAGVNPTSLNSWFTSNSNTYPTGSSNILTKAYGTSSSEWAAGNFSTSPSNLDYRPVSSTGADFTDSSLTPFITAVAGETPIVSNRTYCKGDVATPLTAILTTTGVSLKWYTVATGGTALATAPTPSTATAPATLNYWVSQVNNAGIESARVQLTVTVNALPTDVLGAITGTDPDGLTTTAAITAIGKFVGTTSQFTYVASGIVAPSTSTYFWTVPNGVNIISGQGTNTLVVNFANVPYGAGAVGTIGVQAVNSNGCRTAAKTLALTKALPAAPSTLVLTNRALSGTAATTAITNYGPYMGQSTPLTLTAGTVAAAAAYQWELPAGVSLATGGTPGASYVRWFTTEPFFAPLTTQPAPAVGTKYWRVTYTPVTYNVNGVTTVVTTSTCTQFVQGGGAYGASTSQPYAPYGTVITSDKPAILVSFAGLTSSTTTKVYLGVKAINGVGSSVTSNATNVDVVANNNIPGLFYTTYTEVYTAPVPPSTNATSVITATGTTPSTAKLLALTASLPLAPATVKLTNDAISTITAVTVISKFVGTTTPLTLTAATSALASSYEWELPSGVNVVSGNPLTDRVLTINFAGIPTPTGVTSYYLGVRAKNGIGYSVTNNSALIPATTSTAKLLKVTTSLPTAVATVVGQIAGICPGQTVNYTFTASALANTYTITAPAGCIVTSTNNPLNASNVLASSSDLDFTVTYPTPFVIGTTTPTAGKTISIRSENGVGNSTTNKVLTLSTTMPAIGTVTGGTTYQNCTTQIFSIPAVLGAVSYNWTVDNFASIVTATPTTSIEVDFSECDITKPVNVTVKATNSCGINTTLKKFALTNIACPVAPRQSQLVANEISQVYPNPASDNFNIDINANSGDELTLTIFNLNGAVVKESKTQLNTGANTISENIANLGEGIYFVKIFNVSTNETVVRKLIKK